MEKKKGYGKRPLWQWILIYIVIGGIVYLGVYYFFLRGHYNYSNNYSPSSISYPTSAPNNTNQNTQPQNNNGY